MFIPCPNDDGGEIEVDATVLKYRPATYYRPKEGGYIEEVLVITPCLVCNFNQDDLDNLSKNAFSVVKDSIYDKLHDAEESRY